MSLARYQIDPIFISKKFGKFGQNSADKIQSKKYKGIKVPSPMLIREQWTSLSIKFSIRYIKKLTDRDFVHFFKDFIKIETPSEI